MTIGKDQNNDRFENWLLCGVCKLPFCGHGAIKLTQNCVNFTNPYINLLELRLPPLVNTTPRYLNFSTCCSVLSLTCRIHCLGFVERHNTSVCLVLIFIPAWSHAAENRASACWRLLRSSTKSSAKGKRLILQLPTVTHSSTRLWLSIQFMKTSGSQPRFWGPHSAPKHPLCGPQPSFNKTSNILCNRLRSAVKQNVSIELC